MTFSCARCENEGPRLEAKPLGGTLGEEVLERVCQNCWNEWDEVQLKIINEYRLNLAVPQHYDMLVDELKNYLCLKEGATGSASVSVDDKSEQTY